MAAPIVGPIVIAAATAAIGSFFQNRSAKLTREHQLREAELHQARQIFREVSTSMDSLFYYFRHAALHVAVRRAKGDNSNADEDSKIWNAYDESLVSWTTNKNRFATQVRRYFGEDNEKRLFEIQEGFDKAKSVVAATFYQRKGSVVSNGRENSRKYYGQLTPLEGTISDLGDGMMSKIQHQTVGLLEG